jgi:hypothetical protein
VRRSLCRCCCSVGHCASTLVGASACMQ